MSREKDNTGRAEELNRFALLGKLLGGIAHEINNPVSNIVANIAMLDETLTCDTPDKEEIREISAVLKRSSGKLGELSGLLRDFASTWPAEECAGEGKKASLNRAVEKSLKILENSLKYRFSVETDFRDIPCVLSGEQQLIQVFANLLLIITESVKGRGTVTLGTELTGNSAVARLTGRGEISTCDTFLRELPADPAGSLHVSETIVKRSGGIISYMADKNSMSFVVELPAVKGEADDRQNSPGC